MKELGAMSAETRRAGGKKGYENGIGVISAEVRTAAGKKGYENGIAKGLESMDNKWEEKYAEFDDYHGTPESKSTSYVAK